MALDLGELTARVAVDLGQADKGLTTFERKVLAAARMQVPDVVMQVATGVAEGAIAGLESKVRSIPDAQIGVEVDSGSGLDQLADDAKTAGDDAGDSMGAGIMAALVALPIAGTFLALGGIAAKALTDGLQNEVREDLLVARTGLSPEDAKRIGRAAGEAYAGNFGESIEANFETARIAIQQGLLDPDSTARDSQQVIQSLQGVADIIGEDVANVSRATTALLQSGLVKTADEAFDVIVKGAQDGANAGEDLLDTFTEYPSVLARLGISGQEATGLLSQGLQAGARDSDTLADALKEFQIRATDGSKASADAFELLGLNAEESTAKIAAGGDLAKEGLDEVLDRLGDMEDPVARNAAAVGLFGTKAEDLGAALFALDLDKAAADAESFGDAASGAIAAMGDNAAGSLESAKRNIIVAADAIQGALAQAFGTQIGDFAATVSSNREGVVNFLLDVANAALDTGRALVEGAAAGVEAFGDFVGETGPAVLGTIQGILDGLVPLGIVSDEVRDEFRATRTALEEDMAAFDVSSGVAAEALRTNLITNGIDPVQEKLNVLGVDVAAQARFTDSTTRLATAVGDIGVAADGTNAQIEVTNGTFDKGTEAGRRLDQQIRTATEALEAQKDAGIRAGRSTEELTADYQANRGELVRSIEALGLTAAEADELASSYGAVPKFVATTVSANGLTTTIQQLDALTTKLTRIDGDVVTYTVRQVNQETGRVSVSSVKARARGGPVVKDEPYLVGEEGPELMVAPSDGYVIPAGRTAQLLAQGYATPDRLGGGPAALPGVAPAAGGGDTYHLYGFDAQTEAVAQARARALMREVDHRRARRLQAVGG